MIEVLFGELPKLPDKVSIETIRALRDVNGAEPCPDGVRAAERWLGGRTLDL